LLPGRNNRIEVEQMDQGIIFCTAATIGGDSRSSWSFGRIAKTCRSQPLWHRSSLPGPLEAQPKLIEPVVHEANGVAFRKGSEQCREQRKA
jgi:hypothetical protein